MGQGIRVAEPVPLRTKLLYASSSLGGEALTQSRALWLLYYYDDVLNVAVVGVLLAVGRVIEALDDSLIGYWSDRTRSRWGRRIPFILGATPLWALFAFLLFTPPASSGAAVTALYFLLVLELYFLFSTLSGGPYEALLPEIATASADRVQIAGLKFYFGAAGAGIGLAGSDLLKDEFGFKTMALALAALALVSRYVGLAGVWRRAARSRTPAEVSFREAMRATFANRAFLLFLPSFVLFQIGYQMLVAVLPYFTDEVLGEDTWAKPRVLAAAAIVTAVAAVPLFGLYATRTSKRQAYRGAMVGAACAFPLVAFAGLLPGIPDEAQILAVMVLAGVPIAGNYLFPPTLTADIVDDDSARTGLRREATYYGSQNLVEKVATSLAPLAVALLLLAGRSAENPLGIRLVGPVAGLVVLAGYAVFRRYELPDEVPGRVPSAAGS